MGLFGGTDAPDLTPFLNMMKEAVLQAEGKLGNYDKVLEGFTEMGLERYQASQDLFGPWQERMNNVYQNTTASSYGHAQNETYRTQMMKFNQRASDKFMAAGIPMGAGVGQQRGLSQGIQAAQYEAGVDYASKHQVNQIHEQAMQFGDSASQVAFSQMTAGVNMQQAVSDMWAANAANVQSGAMAQAAISGSQEMWKAEQNMQRQQDFMSNVGTFAGGMASMYSTDSGFFAKEGDTNKNGTFDRGEPGYKSSFNTGGALNSGNVQAAF